MPALPSTNLSPELLAHLNTTAAAQAAGQSVAVSVVDGKYVTVGLDPKTSDLVAITSAPVPLDAALASFMSQLAEVAAGIATGIDHTPKRVTDSLTGTTPYWAEFVMQLLGANGSQGAPVGANVTTVEAAFGEWGSLVLARVDTGSNYFLVDTVNGAVSGPFDFSQAYDARSLLSTHVEYSPTDSVQYFNATGCAVTYPVADTLRLLPCPGPPPTPAGTCPPPAPFAPATHPSRPTDPSGLPTPWSCHLSATGSCTCVSDYTFTAPGPCPVLSPPMATRICIMKVRTECTTPTGCTAAGCGPTPPHPNTTPVTLPPATPGPGSAPIALGCTPTCTAMTYYYVQ